jgi:hypothetical protein
MSFMRPMLPKVVQRPFGVGPVEELEAIGVGNRAQSGDRAGGPTIQNRVTATTGFDVELDKLSGDLGEHWGGFGHVDQCACCTAHRRGSMSRLNQFVAAW